MSDAIATLVAEKLQQDADAGKQPLTRGFQESLPAASTITVRLVTETDNIIGVWDEAVIAFKWDVETGLSQNAKLLMLDKLEQSIKEARQLIENDPSLLSSNDEGKAPLASLTRIAQEDVA